MPYDCLLLLPALADELDALRADPLDLGEERRALVDHGQSTFAEDFNDLFREVRTDPFHQPGPEVAGDPGGGVRRGGAQRLGLELEAVVAVLNPGSARFDVLPGNGVGQMADHRYDPLMSAGLNAQHCEPRVEIMERDPFDDAGEGVGHEGMLPRPVRRR